MAYSQRGESWIKEGTCSLCLNCFTDLVMLECGHHYCRSCMRWFGERTKEKICWECREEIPETNFRPCRSLVNPTAKLRKLNRTVKEKQRKPRCERHGEELKLFCETDKKLICLVCRDSREHKEHRCLPVKEVVQIYEDQRKSSLDSLTEKKSAYLEMELTQKRKISEVREQASSLQTHITAEVTKMHQILADKEQRLLRDLREEEGRIVEPMEKNLREIRENLNSIEEKLTKLQKEKLHSIDKILAKLEIKTDHENDLTYLKEGAFQKRRISSDSQVLQMAEAGDISIGVFKSPLQYALWKEMFGIINPGKMQTFPLFVQQPRRCDTKLAP